MFYSKLDILSEYGYDKKNTGSSEVQVTLLTHKIKYLTMHFKHHKKDEHSRRGLLNMSSKRKKLLSYIKKNSLSKYKQILLKLGLRK
jgi:small subunit ribosomal protein S15